MRKRTLLLMTALLLFGACQDRPGGPLAPEARSDLPQFSMPPGKDKVRVIVRTGGRADQAAVADEARRNGARVIREYAMFPFVALEVNENALQGLLRSRRVVAITEDFSMHPSLDESIPVIGADQVHALGHDGSDQVIGILDTGIDATHPFVAGRVVEEACYSSGPTSLCGNALQEAHGPFAATILTPFCQDGATNICEHGMHVAGIAAGSGEGMVGAPIAGVAPGAKIIAIQVFSRIDDVDDCAPRTSPCVKSFNSDLMAGLEQMLSLSNFFNIAAVNASLGSGVYPAHCDNEPIQVYIGALKVKNVAFVTSSGNDGLAGAVGYPACVSSAITVGSTNVSDNIASTSNRGSLIDLFAPGVGIRSSIAGHDYGVKSGTSMAAPHVAGAIAVMRQADPSLSIFQIEAILKNTGVPITYFTVSGNVTTPRLDLLAALGGPVSQPPTITVNHTTRVVNEGSSITNTGTFGDPDGDAVTLHASAGSVFDQGDGTWFWVFNSTDGPAERQVVTITATDANGATASAAFDLFVTNVAPTVDAGVNATIASGETYNLAASFTDPGTKDSPWNWLVTWGDGSTASGTATAQGQTINANHQFCAVGIYNPTLSVTDKDNGTGVDGVVVTVQHAAANIDIAPGEPAKPLNLKGNGVLPVAILSTPTFDATTVNVAAVTLGDGVGAETHVAERNRGVPYASIEDVNGDGRPDLLLHFRIQDLVTNGDLTTASTQLVLTGGIHGSCAVFRGTDTVVIVP